MRKIIQIYIDHDNCLHALCEDGSLWIRLQNSNDDFFWHRIEDIPQDSSTMELDRG